MRCGCLRFGDARHWFPLLFVTEYCFQLGFHYSKWRFVSSRRKWLYSLPTQLLRLRFLWADDWLVQGKTHGPACSIRLKSKTFHLKLMKEVVFLVGWKGETQGEQHDPVNFTLGCISCSFSIIYLSQGLTKLSILGSNVPSSCFSLLECWDYRPVSPSWALSLFSDISFLLIHQEVRDHR